MFGMKRSVKRQRAAGFSMAEMLTTVAVIGVMSAIMMKVFAHVKERSSEIIATDLVETVNQALTKFVQGQYKITIVEDADSADDEEAILALLQERDPTVPGTPYLRADWNPVASSSVDDYRIQWKGQRFILVDPGEAGFGLKVDFEAGDYN